MQTDNGQEKRERDNLRTRRMTFAALYLAIALALPFITGQIPEIGNMLCPMHLPALLCGFVCGWPWGLAVGFIAPLLRSALFGMPYIFPTAVAMAFELAVYGAVAGMLYAVLPKKKWRVYVALITAMIAGRVIWGLVQYLLATYILQREFTFALFLAGAVTTAIPGIIMQLILIPIIVAVHEQNGLMLNRR